MDIRAQNGLGIWMMGTFRFGWRKFGFRRSERFTNIMRHYFFNGIFNMFNLRCESMYMGFMSGLDRCDRILWRIRIMRDNMISRWIGIMKYKLRGALILTYKTIMWWNDWFVRWNIII